MRFIGRGEKPLCQGIPFEGGFVDGVSPSRSLRRAGAPASSGPAVTRGIPTGTTVGIVPGFERRRVVPGLGLLDSAEEAHSA
ncbi:hypothetical protein B005_2965 [Nocardiopsis alba ATCC BAA-2165]|uniref:Uncharacterized protein n=1 Tax=Nocardiopsis alba (strain ATCC BAA-2165 / BE74) TaxID=1205910 RepID=J7L564_NOCAA|nr:hypothetical protein B005_2965 [Nocardiopsis alba ATCC BAA-2165]